MTDYLTLAEVLAIHDDKIERYGGSPGLRDPGLHEAALFRPQTVYYADLICQGKTIVEGTRIGVHDVGLILKGANVSPPRFRRRFSWPT